jgi:hypothetical protein
MLYLETKWASLIAFEKVVDLLKEVLPVAEATNSQTVREHLHAVAERIELVDQTGNVGQKPGACGFVRPQRPS